MEISLKISRYARRTILCSGLHEAPEFCVDRWGDGLAQYGINPIYLKQISSFLYKRTAKKSFFCGLVIQDRILHNIADGIPLPCRIPAQA